MKNSQFVKDPQLTRQIKVVNTVLKDVSIWLMR